MKKTFRKESDTGGTGGFTLIEMLIVIAIIAILAGIVLVGMTGFQQSARDAKRVATLRNTQNLLELYYARCGYYPGTLGCGGASNLGSWGTMVDALGDEGTKLSTTTTDGKGGSFYFVSCPGGGGSASQAYTLAVQLEKDSTAGGQGIGGAGCALPTGVNCASSTTVCLTS